MITRQEKYVESQNNRSSPVHTNERKTQMPAQHDTTKRKIQQVATIAAGVSTLATAIAVVIHSSRQRARRQHIYYRRALQIRPALQPAPGTPIQA